MKAGDEKIVRGRKYIWVICPDYGEGRWVDRGQARMVRFTGRCQKCYLEIAKQQMGRYHTPKKEVKSGKDHMGN